MNFIQILQRNSLTNALVKTLRVNRLFDAYWGRFPITRKTASGLIYKIEFVPSLVVANEIFSTDDYLKPVSQISPKTFVDLGSNVGYFPILVAEIMESRSLKGLCIEPNPHLHPMIEYHLRVNALNDVHLIKGVVADADVGPEVDFFLNPSHIASSVTGVFDPRGGGGAIQKSGYPWSTFLENGDGSSTASVSAYSRSISKELKKSDSLGATLPSSKSLMPS